MPSPKVEKHLVEVENLKWQIEYERKLHDQMQMMLENKVSNLLADVKKLEENIEEKDATLLENKTEKDQLQKDIDTLEESIKLQRQANVDLKNENFKLLS